MAALPVTLRADLDAATLPQLQVFVGQNWAEMVAYAQQLILIDKLSTTGGTRPSPSNARRTSGSICLEGALTWRTSRH
jgi:hypothetical protein